MCAAVESLPSRYFTWC